MYVISHYLLCFDEISDVYRHSVLLVSFEQIYVHAIDSLLSVNVVDLQIALFPNHQNMKTLYLKILTTLVQIRKKLKAGPMQLACEMTTPSWPTPADG